MTTKMTTTMTSSNSSSNNRWCLEQMDSPGPKGLTVWKYCKKQYVYTDNRLQGTSPSKEVLYINAYLL